MKIYQKQVYYDSNRGNKQLENTETIFKNNIVTKDISKNRVFLERVNNKLTLENSIFLERRSDILEVKLRPSLEDIKTTQTGV